jgi:hypothetical protein
VSEDRDYGIEDGYNDAVSGRAPAYDLSNPAGEYEGAYVKGYQLGLLEEKAQPN